MFKKDYWISYSHIVSCFSVGFSSCYKLHNKATCTFSEKRTMYIVETIIVIQVDFSQNVAFLEMHEVEYGSYM